MQLTVKEMMERRIASVSFIIGVVQYYVIYELTSNRSFEDSQTWRKEFKLALRGRCNASHTAFSPLEASGKYFGGFGSASGFGFGERLGGDLVSVLVAPHYLHGSPQVEALLDEM